MKFWKNHKKLHIWLGADLAVLGLYLALRHDRGLMNGFADRITTPLKGDLGRLCALTSLGAPYLAPLAPRRPRNPDLLLRLPLWRQRLRAYLANPADMRRLSGRMRDWRRP